MTGNDPKNNQREVLTKRAFRDDKVGKESDRTALGKRGYDGRQDG